jgi:hypothetical protein
MMQWTAVLQTAPFLLFGLWWLLLPESVIRFYTAFHKGQRLGLRSPTLIRAVGALWLALVAALGWRDFWR